MGRECVISYLKKNLMKSTQKKIHTKRLCDGDKSYLKMVEV